MGMGAHDQAGHAVAPMPHAHLFAGRLGMEIDDRRLHHAPQGLRLQHRLQRAERVVEGPFHEHLAQGLRDQHAAALRGLEHPRAPAGRHLGKVQRPQDARLGLDETGHVLLVERVIAQRQAIRARRQQLFGVITGEPRALAGVFAVDHDEIQPPGGAQARQPLGHRGPARPADDIAQEKQSHKPPIRGAAADGQANWQPGRKIFLRKICSPPICGGLRNNRPKRRIFVENSSRPGRMQAVKRSSLDPHPAPSRWSVVPIAAETFQRRVPCSPDARPALSLAP